MKTPVVLYMKEWRIFAGYTQAELAVKLKTKRQTLSRIESGKTDFTIKFLVEFANACSCNNFYDPLARPPDHMTYKGKEFDYQPRRAREIMDMMECAHTDEPCHGPEEKSLGA